MAEGIKLRFIDTATLKIRNFTIDDAPPYAVLCHVWGDEEISFQELQEISERAQEPQAGAREKKGYYKIRQLCRAVRRAGIELAWLDSCCINQNDLAERDQTILALASLYSNAEACYVLLEDTTAGHSDIVLSPPLSRGWTSQELLLSKEVVFYDRKWKPMGRICNHGSDCPMQNITPSLDEQISAATGISLACLRGEELMRPTDHRDGIGWLINHPQATMVDFVHMMTRNTRDELADDGSQQSEELENSTDDLDRTDGGNIIEELG